MSATLHVNEFYQEPGVARGVERCGDLREIGQGLELKNLSAKGVPGPSSEFPENETRNSHSPPSPSPFRLGSVMQPRLLPVYLTVRLFD